MAKVSISTTLFPQRTGSVLSPLAAGGSPILWGLLKGL